MGIKVALTALVVFVFAIFMSNLAKEPPRHEALFTFFAVVGLLAFCVIPIGLILAVWQ